jgi:hypothetical protein
MVNCVCFFLVEIGVAEQILLQAEEEYEAVTQPLSPVEGVWVAELWGEVAQLRITKPTKKPYLNAKSPDDPTFMHIQYVIFTSRLVDLRYHSNVDCNFVILCTNEKSMPVVVNLLLEEKYTSVYCE